MPSPRFKNRKLGFMSLATKMSIRPSSLTSAATTPNPWPSSRGSGRRTFFLLLVAGSSTSCSVGDHLVETSVNVRLPLLW